MTASDMSTATRTTRTVISIRRKKNANMKQEEQKKSKCNNKNNSTTTGTIYIPVYYCGVNISNCTILLLFLLLFLLSAVDILAAVRFLSHYYYHL